MTLRVIVAVLCGVLLPTLAAGEPRRALVIGNSDYGKDVGVLPNPANDADLIGNGIQAGGVNYLIPVTATIADESDLAPKTIAADSVLRTIEFAGSQVSILILDACRNNPLARTLKIAGQQRRRRLSSTGSISSVVSPCNDGARRRDSRRLKRANDSRV